ncbi:hypothetical protein ABZT17_00350 [Streptomyces sp. NPDC005648]|uniref:hypothetical protein n=1 Tax=Streptomyces sp. NPDC005648 TaxID=3157044 RepID=UPI0033A2824D
MDAAVRQEALRRLDVLVGEWVVEADFPGMTTSPGRSVFEWGLNGQFLIQRTEAPDPAPDSMAIIAVNPVVPVDPLGTEGSGYTYHYYDTRGVVRLYDMSLADGAWQLLRERPDFTPLDFRQRYFARIAEGGPDGSRRPTIVGAWEKAVGDSTPWELDFVLSYRRSH